MRNCETHRLVTPGTKIIFVTQNSDREVMRTALSTGPRGYVLKTDAGTELLPTVYKVLPSDDFASSGIAGNSSQAG